MKYWNKETYAGDRFYRLEDWGMEIDDPPLEKFTSVEPKGLDQAVVPKQHWDEDLNDWVLDEDIDRGTLNAMASLSKLKLLEALDSLPDERAKFDTLMANDLFKERWLVSLELELNHPLTQQALQAVDIDIDLIKRQMLSAEA
jgi:hypothetical protein